jgi:CDP-diglyceride synthetase
MWAFACNQLLGQVLSQVIFISLAYLSVRELEAIRRHKAVRGRDALVNYWCAMTIVWCAVMSSVVWLVPNKGVYIVQCLALTMMLADACALGAGMLARHVFKHKTLGEIWPTFKNWSPNKTIAGSVACVLVAWAGFATLVALAVQANWLALGSLAFTPACIVLVLFPVFGVVGDFFESHIKRVYGVKDSAEVLDPNRIIPWGRHGGASDRIDSHVGGVAGFAAIAAIVMAVIVAVITLVLYLMVAVGIYTFVGLYALYDKFNNK